MSALTPARFRRDVLKRFRSAGRSFPWRETRDPYAILVSEVMLQQTQTERVRAYYLRFLAEFPTPAALAAASPRRVLELWQGLGYNRRALALQRAAKEIVRRHGGCVPPDHEALLALPGVGPYTAAAVRVFAFGAREAMIETNVRTVYLHHFFPSGQVRDEAILDLVRRHLPRGSAREWFYALMDYGAALKAARVRNNHRSRHYRRAPKFEGSDRQVRGAIVRTLLAGRAFTLTALSSAVGFPPKRVQSQAERLAKEGIIVTRGQAFVIEPQ